MKAQYGILRFKKYKGPAISPIEAHNERTKEQYASNPEYCNIMHADGAGTKSSLAYMYWKETGDRKSVV